MANVGYGFPGRRCGSQHLGAGHTMDMASQTDHSFEIGPDTRYLRPYGASDATVDATGKLSEALEWIEREHMAGRRHVFEAELKEERRTKGKAGHEPCP